MKYILTVTLKPASLVSLALLATGESGSLVNRTADVPEINVAMKIDDTKPIMVCWRNIVKCHLYLYF